jgi:hypothetical protein
MTHTTFPNVSTEPENRLPVQLRIAISKVVGSPSETVEGEKAKALKLTPHPRALAVLRGDGLDADAEALPQVTTTVESTNVQQAASTSETDNLEADRSRREFGFPIEPPGLPVSVDQERTPIGSIGKKRLAEKSRRALIRRDSGLNRRRSTLIQVEGLEPRSGP